MTPGDSLKWLLECGLRAWLATVAFPGVPSLESVGDYLREEASKHLLFWDGGRNDSNSSSLGRTDFCFLLFNSCFFYLSILNRLPMSFLFLPNISCE